MQKIYLTVLFLAMFLANAKAQNIPRLGSASDALWSKSAELNIGKAAYDRLYRQGHIYETQADNDYLNYLGQKIGAFTKTRLGLTFYLTNAKTINAFATPGGYIGVNAGLVLRTDNEHELAGVLAHEIAHVAQEHIARSMLAAKDRQIANAAAMLAGVLLATAGDAGEAGESVISAVVAGETQRQINDIRRHEIEADKTGRQLMTQAGFSEKGMQHFFAKLRTPVFADTTPAYLLTHPVPLERQAAIDNPHGGNHQKRLHSSDEYYLFRARLRSAMLSQQRIQDIIQQEQAAGNPQISDAARYLSALAAMKKGQFGNALAQLTGMQTKMKNKRDVGLLKAKLSLLQGQNAAAENIYRRLWQRFSGDSVVAYDYGGFLMRQGHYRQAEKLLSKQLDNDSLNPQLYWLYGQILGKCGEKIKQNRLLIRFYQQSGDYERALAQAQIAAKLPAVDWQSRSMFEAKQKELQRIIDSLKE
ncbi:MAG: hypothetical protein CR975_00630 [Gammaproteobacteria bacterium]|nr:MAG: hypothetical protein CR975_00630 [Gammaproteobacteria bacterium]